MDDDSGQHRARAQAFLPERLLSIEPDLGLSFWWWFDDPFRFMTS